MSKHVRKILPLLLCLLLMACLLPAAYAADEVNVNFSTPEELQNAISAHNQLLAQDSSARTSASASGDFTITGELTLPKGFRLRTDYKLTIAANAVVTVNGKLDAKGGGYIDILGKVINYGQVRMFDTGVIHVAGTLENRSQIEYEDVSPDIKHLVIDQKENLQIYGPINVYAGVSPTESVLGVNVDNWCRSIPKDNPDVSIYIPLFGIQLEDKSSSGRYSYIEVRGTEAYTLTKDMTVPAGTEVVMNNIVLTVPDGNTLTVNGELTVKDLVVEDGGNVFTGDGGSIKYAAEDTEPKVGSLSQLQASISAFNQLREQDPSARIDVYTSGDFTITGNITIPDGFQLRCGNNLTIAAEATVTVNGKLDAIDNGYINILGKVVNYGQVRMFGSGVIHVGGTLENRSQICYENVTSDVKHLVVDKKENLQIWGPFCVYDGVSLTENVLGFPVDNWCRSIKKDEPDVSAFIPLFGIQLEDKSSSGSYSYIEVRGTEAFTLTKDMTVPAGTEVVMNSIVLTVPNGKSLTVNGELVVKELVIENGGSVTVSGYLDAVNGITLNNDGALTVNNTHIDAGYVPTTNIEALKNIVYIGDANLLLHLVVWPSDDVPNAIRTASNAVDENVNCMVELRTGWTVTDATDCHLITLKVRKDGTLTVNNELIVKDLIVDDGGTVIKGPNGSITYAADSGIEALREAIANPAISEFELRGSPVTLTEALTVPSDFTVKVGSGSSLVIPAGVDVNLKGRLVLRDGAALELAGSMRKGTLELDEGATVNLTGTCRLEPDKLRLDGEIAATGGGMSEPKLMALNNGRPNGRITVTAGSRPSVRIDGLDETKLSEWVKFNDNEGYFVLYYHAESDAEFSATMEDMKALPARFYGIQKLDYAAVVRGNVVFPGIEIRVAGYDGASLTIAEGAVLTAPTVMLQGAQMTVNGTFISISRDEPYNNHNGALILTQNDGLDAMLTVTDTGIVGGTDCSIELPQGTTDPTRYVSGINPGQLKVVPDPYRPFKIYAVAPELHLPESLNAIESEAFAGGSFNSVYIPNSVTSIAFDAFGDMTGLKVYGEYGTEAAQFASDHHFPFAPLAWRGNQ